jgi:hypothetical protein
MSGFNMICTGRAIPDTSLRAGREEVNGAEKGVGTKLPKNFKLQSRTTFLVKDLLK